MSIPLDRAQTLALHMVDRLLENGLAERVEIAGSVRRMTPTVNDIDIVVAPRWTPQLVDMFGGASDWQPQGLDRWLAETLKGSAGRVTWDMREDGGIRRQVDLRALRVDGILVELWLAQAPESDNFGALLQMRTGPREWNIALISQARRMACQYKAGKGIFRGSDRVDDDTEEGIFQILGLPSRIPPRRRHDPTLIKALGEGRLTIDVLNSHKETP